MRVRSWILAVLFLGLLVGPVAADEAPGRAIGDSAAVWDVPPAGAVARPDETRDEIPDEIIVVEEAPAPAPPAATPAKAVPTAPQPGAPSVTAQEVARSAAACGEVYPLRTVQCDPCEAPCPCSKGYGGFVPSMWPGLGFGVEFGRVFKITPTARWSWEVNLNYQDLYSEFNNNENQAGKWIFARAGIKATLSPQRRSHLVGRFGFAFGNATEDPGRNLDIGSFDAPGRGEYWGGYVGIGYEWDLFDCCVTTGPELQVFAGARPSGSGWAVAPSLMWHILFNM